MFNVFRLVADFLHLASFFILIQKIRKSKNCLGILLFPALFFAKSILGLSGKTQELYLVVFCTRYLDLFYRFQDQNLYLITMKILFIAATAYIINLMRFEKPYCVVSYFCIFLFSYQSYDALGDDFKHWKFLLPGNFSRDVFVYLIPFFRCCCPCFDYS